MTPVMRRLRNAFSTGTHPLVYAVAAVVLALVVGRELAVGGRIGPLVFVAVLGVLIFLIRPVNAAIICLFGVYVVQRLGGTSSAPGSNGGLTYSDALIAVVMVIAFLNLVGRPELTRLRTGLLAFTVYLVALLPSVLLHNATAGYRELVHRVILVAGSMLVGAWIVREDAVTKALRAFIVFSGVVALLAIANATAHGFAPASPLGLNKNLVGSQFAIALVLVLAAPSRVGMALKVRVISVLILAAGLGLTQSRGAMVTAGVALLFAALVGRTLRGHGAKLLVLALVAAIGVGVYFSVTQQLASSNSNTNALGVRFNVEKETRRIWRTSPIIGVGMKYFNSGSYGPFAQVPNNVVDNELAESGVIGLVGFAIFQIGAIGATARRRRNPLTVVSGGIVLGYLAHGQVDIYWSAGATALPYLILGMGLAERVIPASRGDHASEYPERTTADECQPKISSSALAITASRV